MTHLGAQWPDVAQDFAALPVDRQRSVAHAAALAALVAVAVPVPHRDAGGLENEIHRLDEVAWDLQDGDGAATGAYEAAFRRARAVAAFHAAEFGDDPGEAVYEALHALGAPADASFILDV
jgi:hypothetical protein